MRFLLSLLLVASAAHAQYPAKPVRVVIGYAAGSSTDIVGRVMADRLSAYWKQSVYVETRAGAAGNLAADAVAKAAGDGYTLLFAQNGLAISAAALPNLPYSAERDLVALSPVAATPHILIVAPDFPAKNVQELIARAKAEPGKLSFASSGVGNSDHLCGELFNLMAGISAIHVPYKGGAPAAVDVMAGRIGYYFAGMPVGVPLAKSGKAPALGVTSKERFASAPDVPTIAAQGLPRYAAMHWLGFYGACSVPADLASRTPADIEQVNTPPETQENLAGASVTVWAGNQADFKRACTADIAKWRDVVKKANLKLD